MNEFKNEGKLVYIVESDEDNIVANGDTGTRVYLRKKNAEKNVPHPNYDHGGNSRVVTYKLIPAEE